MSELKVNCLTSDEVEHLRFIYGRMSNVHKENQNFDYMLKFEKIIDKLDQNINKLPTSESFKINELDLTKYIVLGNDRDFIEVQSTDGSLESVVRSALIIGVKDFSLFGGECLDRFNYNGKTFVRSHTSTIPPDWVGKVCSVQIYKEFGKLI